MTETILPCPFCGNKASIEEVVGACGMRFSVGCDNTESADCMGYQSFTTFDTRGEAVKAWNRRGPAVVYCQKHVRVMERPIPAAECEQCEATVSAEKPYTGTRTKMQCAARGCDGCLVCEPTSTAGEPK